MTSDDFVYDEDLLIEAARYAVKTKVDREAFMKQAKQAWYRAATEVGRNPQTLRKNKSRPAVGA